MYLNTKVIKDSITLEICFVQLLHSGGKVRGKNSRVPV